MDDGTMACDAATVILRLSMINLAIFPLFSLFVYVFTIPVALTLTNRLKNQGGWLLKSGLVSSWLIWGR